MGVILSPRVMKNYLDIGCNILDGYNCMRGVEDFSSIQKMVFVEPNPECWDYLDATLQEATVIKKAVSTKVETVELITREDQLRCIGATIKGQDYYESNLRKHNIYVSGYNKYSVEATTIENILKECDLDPKETLLKLDAEGVEYDVLEDLISKKIIFGKIYCEFHLLTPQDHIRRQDIISNFLSLGCTVIDWH